MHMTMGIILSGLCLLFVTGASAAELSEREAQGLAAEMILSTMPSEFEALNVEFDNLSPSEKNLVVRSMRSLQNESLRGLMTEDEFQEFEAAEYLFVLAEEMAGNRYLGDLPDAEFKELFAKALQHLDEASPEEARQARSVLNSTTDQGNKASSCPLYSYPRVHGGSTPAVPTVSATSVYRTVNESGEWPCDYEVRFGSSKSRVYGQTYATQRLILDFGGSVISRLVSGGDRLLFGYLRSNYWLGFCCASSRLKSDIKIF